MSDCVHDYLEPQALYRFVLKEGGVIEARLMASDPEWFALVSGEESVLLARSAVQLVATPGFAWPPAPAGKKRGAGGSKKAAPAARSWSDADLRRLAGAYLDGEGDAELAESWGCSRSLIRVLRLAFECARGNVVEEDLPAASQAWLGRWAAVLQP